MSFKEFIQPTKKKILFFVPLFVIFIMMFNSFNVFPCYSKPLIFGAPGPIEWELTLCSLSSFNYIPFYHMVGTVVRHTVWSVLMMIIMFLVIPYVLACSLSSVKKK